MVVTQEKRYRDFGTQVDTQCRDGHAQTDATWSELALEKLKQEKKKKKKPAVTHLGQASRRSST